MNIRESFFQKNKGCRFVGCLHLLPLPGSAGWAGNMPEIIDICLKEAGQYLDNGADALLIENTHDTPYLRQEAEPGTIAAMASVATFLRKAYPEIPIGIQLLAAGDMAALDIAIVCDLDFIRAEGFAYAHIADEGIIQGNAARLLRRRAHLQANKVRIFTDIKKKHSAHAITADVDLLEMAKGVLFCKADGLIVTGNTTGEPPDAASLEAVSGLDTLLAVGSGVTPENIRQFAQYADYLIVGSACKSEGDWRNSVVSDRVKALTDLLK